MRTTAAEAASRFAKRPGFDLVAFREVGLPIYRLTLVSVVMVDKRLPALQEFVLRAVDAGFETPQAIASFLGLDERDLDAALYGLVAERFIELRSSPTRDGDPLALTKRGHEVMEEFRLTQAEERTYVIDFDGLLRRPVSHRGWAVREKALKETGAITIAPSPPCRPPVADLDITQVEAVLREGKSLDKSRRLLELLHTTRTDTLFVPATMLVFRAHVGDEVQAAFVIDQRLSEEHSLAFAEAQGPARLGLLAMSKSDLEAAAQEVLGRDVAGSALAELQPTGARSDKNGADPIDTGDARPTYELLETFDHPRYLEEALNASNRLVIVSPWIKNRVVNEAFVGRLRSLLNKGTDVFIGFGFGKEGGPGDDRGAVRALQRLANEHPNFTFRRFGNSHAKILICDGDYAIITSFNWLSFVGDPDRTFRDERGLLVRRTDVIEEVAQRLFARFAEASAPDPI